MEFTHVNLSGYQLEIGDTLSGTNNKISSEHESIVKIKVAWNIQGI